MAIRFPQTLAAAKAAEKDQWALGDALLNECGPPGDDHGHNGSFAKLQAAQAELESHGLEYATNTLRTYRDVAHTFPHAARMASVSQRVHIECRTPEMLQAVFAAWKKEKPDKPLSLHTCSRLMIELRRQRKTKWEREQGAAHRSAQRSYDRAKDAVSDARERYRTAVTPADREATKAEISKAVKAAQRAAQRVDETAPLPQSNPLDVPPPERLTTVIYGLEVIKAAREATGLAKKVRDMAEQTDLDRLDEDTLAGMIEQSLIAAKEWREIAEMMRNLSKTKGALLTVVNE